MIARRLRLAFLNVQAAAEALPAIVDIMAEELKWNEAEKTVLWPPNKRTDAVEKLGVADGLEPEILVKKLIRM